MKKLVSLLLAIAMTFTFCGALAEEDGKITIWTWDPTFNIKAMEIARDMSLRSTRTPRSRSSSASPRTSKRPSSPPTATPAPCRTFFWCRTTPSRSS